MFHDIKMEILELLEVIILKFSEASSQILLKGLQCLKPSCIIHDFVAHSLPTLRKVRNR